MTSPRTSPGRAATFLVVAALFAPAARAQLAVSTAIAADDAAQRDIAAAVVRAASAQWDLLTPPLSAAATEACKAGDTDCLRKAAQAAGASHLLVVGVAPLGARDHIAVVQLFDVTNATAVFEESVVQPGGDVEQKQVADLVRRLIGQAGPPAKKPDIAPVTVEPAGPGLGTWVGVGLIGAGGVGALVTVLTGVGIASAHDPLAAGNASVVGIAASAGLIAAGSVVIAVDSF